MVAKVPVSPESSSSSKAVRDAMALSNESAPDGDGLSGLNNQLIKSMANDIAFKQVESQRDSVEASQLEARKKKIILEREVATLEKPLVSSIAGMAGGYGPLGMSQLSGGNAEVIKAALGALETDEARLKYLDEHKHLLYGGAPGPEAFTALLPKAPAKGDSDIGSILTGMANMQLAQGQEQRNSLVTMFELQNKLRPQVPAVPVVGGQSEDTKLMVGAMMKLAESFAAGQNQMQKDIAQLREEKVKSEQVLWEKYFMVQREADDERRKNQEERSMGVIAGLQEKIEKMEKMSSDTGGVRGELAQLRSLMEKGKEFGLNLTNKTPEEDRSQRDYDLALARLSMEEKLMTKQADSEAARTQSFNNKINVFSSLLAIGYDAMSAKKQLQKANPNTVGSLSAGL
jgi:hypothetical protein